MEQVITAEQIHKDFYGAEERLYVEAIGLSKGSLVNSSSKSDRLKKIGFGKAKPIKDDQILQEKRKVAGHMIHVIEYFRTYYPQYKFITEAEVKILCEKYGLLLGDASSYTGDMPEKNLQDIEKFKLRKEDWKEKIVFEWLNTVGMQIERPLFFQEPRRSPFDSDVFGYVQYQSRQTGRLEAEIRRMEYESQARQMEAQLARWPLQYAIGVDPYKKGEEKKEYEQPAFKICAPKQDFDTRGFVVQDGYKLIYDPIVLQPVSKEGIGGYLIVTAWGDEAKDEVVTNPINN